MGNMSCWDVLGIQETNDQEVIREAYLKKLPQVHPEEDPKGFQLLRSAMEEAVRAAMEMERENDEDVKETDMMDSREIRSFLREVQELYRDFERRILPGQWKELLSCGADWVFDQAFPHSSQLFYGYGPGIWVDRDQGRVKRAFSGWICPISYGQD